jgi:hypothetical protein
LKNIFSILIVLTLSLGGLGGISQVSAKRPVFVELSFFAKRQGITLSEVFGTSHTCVAPRATRVLGGQAINYSNVVFHLSSQLAFPGKLLVSRDTKCVQDFDWQLDWKKFRFISWGFPHPDMMSLGHFMSWHHDAEGTPWCRANRIVVSHLPVWIGVPIQSQRWLYQTHSRVVLYIPTTVLTELPLRTFPKPTQVLVSKDFKCFASKEQALIKGYTEISW